MSFIPKDIKTLLIVTLSNLGDVILTLPIVPSFQAQWPGVAIHVVVGERVYPLLEGNPTLAQVWEYNKESSLFKKARFIYQLRKKKFDFVLDFRNSLIPYLVGCPSHSLQVNKKMRKIESRYERITFLQQLLELPQGKPETFPLYQNAESESFMKKIHSAGLFTLQNILVVAPGARSYLKRWPYEYFVNVIDALYREKKMIPIIVGEASDYAVGEQIELLLPHIDIINLCGKITQKELAVLIERARIVVSNDSAVMHLANYYRRPVVGIFGPTNYKKYGGVYATTRIAHHTMDCVPCEKSVCLEHASCLRELKPNGIIDLALELLS